MLLSNDNILKVCRSLSKNNKVKEINLSNNIDLTDKSIEFILELICEKKNINKINLSNNYKLSEDMITKLNNRLIKNVNFQYFNILLSHYNSN